MSISSITNNNSSSNSGISQYSASNMSGKDMKQDNVENQRRSLFGGSNLTTAEHAGSIASNAQAKYLDAVKQSSELGEQIAQLDRKIELNKKEHWFNHNVDTLELSPWTKEVKTDLNNMKAEREKLVVQKEKFDTIVSNHQKSFESQLKTQASATESNVLSRAEKLRLGEQDNHVSANRSSYRNNFNF